MESISDSAHAHAIGTDEPKEDTIKRCPVVHLHKQDQRPVQADSFYMQPIMDPIKEGEAFLRQMFEEDGISGGLEARLTEMRSEFQKNGTWHHNLDELTFGAKLAWRNSVRCVGRMFWRSLKLFDARDAETPEDIFEAILSHLEWATNGGNLRAAITIFRPGEPQIRVLNSQLLLYAGYKNSDGTILGDPKNVAITELALKLGWRGRGTRFDILPLLIKIGDKTPEIFDIPQDKVLEVQICHAEYEAIEALGLKWFALPAVSGMSLDLGGIQYTAAPSNGIYQGTEIGSFNLGDPKRYNQLPEIAKALQLDTSRNNPLWRDQAMVELNRAVLHSFNSSGVRIMDHHTLSSSFEKFCQREEMQNRKVYGHWPWIVPPLSANLSWIWHEKSFSKIILKPNYFYQT
ncbi:nitric-oxide synthase [Rhizobium skierniewicense]|uniref:Nitric oxide synthase oxygenase n=1 Tax=Rhizobium skierniewicense TaxID=984260 RepID=A0A7W6CFN8_9HYPH|nr:nitric oxide synthase oxygenase [Rhizobium skierniewicense]MBB3948554.1 nitric-oxide synthase [Rhizobium skierniewicense]